jgi:transcription elongation factor S-II
LYQEQDFIYGSNQPLLIKSKQRRIMSTTSKVVGIKKSLSKLIPADGLAAEELEQCRDLLMRLDECNVNLEVLTSTLIGTVVSKFKKHEEVGPTAKALLKKWKKVASGEHSAAPTSKKTPSKPAKIERRDSTNSVTDAAKEEWNGLASYRQNICQKLFSFLQGAKPSLVKDGINETAVDSLLVDRTTEVEAAIDIKHRNNKSEYASKARSLCFNIKKNIPLAGQIILGQIHAEDLVNMSSEELASEEQRAQMAKRAKDITDAKRLDWDRANEDKINAMCGIKGDLLRASLFTCGRCKSIKTTSTQKQTRSADEPMTVFVLCLNCGKRWRC